MGSGFCLENGQAQGNAPEGRDQALRHRQVLRP
jgi:hypothetical protein